MVWHVDNKTGVKVRPLKNPVHSETALHFSDQLGQTPTIPQADWFNMMQAELLGLASALGVTPDKLDDNQLGNALLSFFEAQPISAGYSSSRKYQTGTIVYVDGIYYEAYHPDGCLGIDPRDPANRPAGWTNTDETAPYFWIKLGQSMIVQSVGVPYDGLAIEGRAENALPWIDFTGKLHAKKFWRLADRYPTLVKNNYLDIIDLRGYFVRTFDDGRGIDLDGKLGEPQRGSWVIYDEGGASDVVGLRSGNPVSGAAEHRKRLNYDQPHSDYNYLLNNGLFHEMAVQATRTQLIKTFFPVSGGNEIFGISRPQNYALPKFINF